MKINLYDENGYLNFRAIKNLPYNFIFIVGGRGTGKTYGALKCQMEDQEPFVYVRRLQTQAEMAFSQELSPFKPVCEDLDLPEWWPEHIPHVKGASALYRHSQDEDGKWRAEGRPLALLLSLATVANVRGLSGEDYKTLYIDEFIRKKQERPIPDEAGAFFDLYETLNRNRELKGNKPLKAILMANANDLGNPYFLKLGMVRRAQKMRERGVEFYADDKKGIALIILQESTISQRKKKTALYKLTEGTDYAAMSVENDWSGEEIGRTSARKLIEYKALVRVGEITIYKHKSRDEYYVSTFHSGTCSEFTAGETSLARFRRSYLWLWREYMRNTIIFEEYLCEILFQKYFG